MKTNGVKANGGNADTLDGKGISYFAKDGHKHQKSDIEDFPAALPADGGNADTVAGKTPGIAAGNILVLDGQGKVPKENQYSNDKDFRLYWQVNETVAKDDIRFLHYGPTWAYLNCIQAGQTGSSEPDPSLIVEGEKITDGSVRWEVLQLGNPPKVGGILAKAFALLSGAIFTGIIKAVAPAADSNDDSVPTTSWVLAVLQKIFREHIVKDYSMEQNGYIQGGDWVGGLILQWGYTTNNNGTWALNFNTVLSAVVTGSPGYPAREFCGFNFNYTMTGWSFNAGYGSPVTYLNGVCVSAIAIGF